MSGLHGSSKVSSSGSASLISSSRSSSSSTGSASGSSGLDSSSGSSTNCDCFTDPNFAYGSFPGMGSRFGWRTNFTYSGIAEPVNTTVGSNAEDFYLVPRTEGEMSEVLGNFQGFVTFSACSINFIKFRIWVDLDANIEFLRIAFEVNGTDVVVIDPLPTPTQDPEGLPPNDGPITNLLDGVVNAYEITLDLVGCTNSIAISASVEALGAPPNSSMYTMARVTIIEVG